MISTNNYSVSVYAECEPFESLEVLCENLVPLWVTAGLDKSYTFAARAEEFLFRTCYLTSDAMKDHLKRFSTERLLFDKKDVVIPMYKPSGAYLRLLVSRSSRGVVAEILRERITKNDSRLILETVCAEAEIACPYSLLDACRGGLQVRREGPVLFLNRVPAPWRHVELVGTPAGWFEMDRLTGVCKDFWHFADDSDKLLSHFRKLGQTRRHPSRWKPENWQAFSLNMLSKSDHKPENGVSR